MDLGEVEGKEFIKVESVAKELGATELPPDLNFTRCRYCLSQFAELKLRLGVGVVRARHWEDVHYSRLSFAWEPERALVRGVGATLCGVTYDTRSVDFTFVFPNRTTLIITAILMVEGPAFYIGMATYSPQALFTYPADTIPSTDLYVPLGFAEQLRNEVAVKGVRGVVEERLALYSLNDKFISPYLYRPVDCRIVWLNNEDWR